MVVAVVVSKYSVDVKMLSVSSCSNFPKKKKLLTLTLKRRKV